MPSLARRKVVHAHELELDLILITNLHERAREDLREIKADCLEVSRMRPSALHSQFLERFTRVMTTHRLNELAARVWKQLEFVDIADVNARAMRDSSSSRDIEVRAKKSCILHFHLGNCRSFVVWFELTLQL